MTRIEFEKVVERALEILPRRIRDALENLAIIIEDHPSAEDLEDVGLSRNDYLFGLYRGVPINNRSFFDPGGQLPHQIILFQGELEECCPDKRRLMLEITLTLVHEVGHYIGLDEDELRQLESASSIRLEREPPDY